MIIYQVTYVRCGGISAVAPDSQELHDTVSSFVETHDNRYDALTAVVSSVSLDLFIAFSTTLDGANNMAQFFGNYQRHKGIVEVTPEEAAEHGEPCWTRSAKFASAPLRQG